MEVNCRESRMHRTMLNIENKIPRHRKTRRKEKEDHAWQFPENSISK